MLTVLLFTAYVNFLTAIRFCASFKAVNMYTLTSIQ